MLKYNLQFHLPLSLRGLRLLLEGIPENKEFIAILTNQVTMFNILFIIIPFLLFAKGGYLFGLLGTIALFFNLILDCFDGSLARFRNAKSLSGRYLEQMFHVISVPMIMFGLSIFSFKHFGNVIILYMGTLTAMSIFISVLSRVKKDSILYIQSLKDKKLIKSKNIIVSIRNEESKDPLKRLVLAFIYTFSSIGHQYIVLFLTALLGYLHYAIFFYFPFYVLILFGKFYLEIKKGIPK